MIRVTPIMRSALLANARLYAKTAGVPLRSVSRKAYGDSRFFTNVGRGGTFTSQKYDDAMVFFFTPQNWPEGRVPDSVVNPFAPGSPQHD